MKNRVSKKRTVCEVLREINDMHQRNNKHDKEIRMKLFEAEYMAKRMSLKLLELQPDIYDKGWWKKNKNFAKSLVLRMKECYKIIQTEDEKERSMKRENDVDA
jgi:hypothetical protein